MRRRLASLFLLAACKPVPPPPMVPSHVSTSPEERGSTSVMFVIGFAGELFSAGIGAAVRVEHQQFDHQAFGVELGGGRGEEDHRGTGEKFRHWLFAVRGYGRRDVKDYFAVAYGVGLSVMRTGLVTLTLSGGESLDYPNQYVIPKFDVGVYLAVPLVHGFAYGGATLDTAEVPTTKLGLYTSLGAIVPVERADLSIDFGMAVPVHDSDSEGVLSLSAATAVHGL